MANNTKIPKEIKNLVKKEADSYAKIINRIKAKAPLPSSITSKPNIEYTTYNSRDDEICIRDSSDEIVYGTQDIQLRYDLQENYVGFYIHPDNPDIEQIFRQLPIMLIKEGDTNAWYIPSSGVNQIGEIKPEYGYRITLDASSTHDYDPITFSVTGCIINPEKVGLKLDPAGWSYIPYLGNIPTTGHSAWGTFLPPQNDSHLLNTSWFIKNETGDIFDVTDGLDAGEIDFQFSPDKAYAFWWGGDQSYSWYSSTDITEEYWAMTDDSILPIGPTCECIVNEQYTWDDPNHLDDRACLITDESYATCGHGMRPECQHKFYCEIPCQNGIECPENYTCIRGCCESNVGPPGPPPGPDGERSSREQIWECSCECVPVQPQDDECECDVFDCNQCPDGFIGPGAHVNPCCYTCCETQIPDTENGDCTCASWELDCPYGSFVCEETQECQLYGDVNGDGAINVVDIVLSVNDILSPDELLEGCSLQAADVTGDGTLDVLDIVQTVNCVLGTESDPLACMWNVPESDPNIAPCQGLFTCTNFGDDLTAYAGQDPQNDSNNNPFSISIPLEQIIICELYFLSS